MHDTAGILYELWAEEGTPNLCETTIRSVSAALAFPYITDMGLPSDATLELTKGLEFSMFISDSTNRQNCGIWNENKKKSSVSFNIKGAGGKGFCQGSQNNIGGPRAWKVPCLFQESDILSNPRNGK